MTEAILLGTVAVRIPDTRLEWDRDAMRFRNGGAADRLLRALVPGRVGKFDNPAFPEGSHTTCPST